MKEPAADAAGEGDEARGTGPGEVQDCVVAEVEVLEHAGRQARLIERLLEALGAQGCLRGMLEKHGVASGKGGMTALTAVR